MTLQVSLRPATMEDAGMLLRWRHRIPAQREYGHHD